MRLLFLLFLAAILSFNSYSQSTASPQIQKFEIQAPQLDTLKNIWVYLPKNYQESNQKYPVIYMHDAQNLFDNETSYVGEWKIDESLDSLGKPYAIIVGIEHGGEKRIQELTPFPNEKYGGGNGEQYLDFIKNTLKPYIDDNYRTKSGFKHTGIFGSSLGGLISFYAALKYPDTFGMIGTYSPSFWFNEKIYDYTEKAEINKAAKFYFLVGTEESEEMVPDTKKMLDLLSKKGLKAKNLKFKFVEGGKHNEEMWSGNFLKTYLWLMQPNKN